MGMMVIRNNNSTAYVDTFEDKEIVIPPGGTYKMPITDGRRFFSRMSPPDPKTKRPVVKNLDYVIEKGELDDKIAEEKAALVSMKDGSSFASPDELQVHLDAVQPRAPVAPMAEPEINARFEKLEGAIELQNKGLEAVAGAIANMTETLKSLKPVDPAKAEHRSFIDKLKGKVT